LGLPDATHSDAVGVMIWARFADHERLCDWRLETLDVLKHLARLGRIPVSLLNGIEAPRIGTKGARMVGQTRPIHRMSTGGTARRIQLRTAPAGRRAAQVEHSVVTSPETGRRGRRRDGQLLWLRRALANDKDLIPVGPGGNAT
jgi:hypothetical protein